MSTPPIEPTEILFRQVGPGGNPPIYDPDGFQAVHHSLFLPSGADTDGLSLIRRRYRSAPWAAHRVEQPQRQFRLAHLEFHDIERITSEVDLGAVTIDVTPDSLDQHWGSPYAHCVVKQINIANRRNSGTKRRVVDWALKMAAEITQDKISGPYAVPTKEIPYRPEP